MANAHPAVKAAARYETASNEEGGVLLGIRRLMAKGLICAKAGECVRRLFSCDLLMKLDARALCGWAVLLWDAPRT